ncbi:MAG: hypothetical protein NC228_03955 [[Eubacterium] siraeum]|nr:hypothetical protein [[Eubacterium] siraeum]
MKLKKFKAAALILCLTVFSLTACSAANTSDNTTVDSKSTETEKAVETAVPETVQSTSASEETTAVTEFDDIPWQNYYYRPEDNTRIELFTSSISDDEGKEYTLNVYMYHIDNGYLGTQLFPIKEGMLRGDVEAELLYNGEKLYTSILAVGGGGNQVANSYYIPDIESNFKVLHLAGGDVFAYACSDNSGLWFNSFYTVKDGKLRAMERYFSDEEQKLIGKDTTYKGIIPRFAVYEFIATHKFTVDGNRIIYELDFETPGIQEFSYEIGSYPPGEIPLLFDFEANTVKCEKDEYSGLVYEYFDVI